MINCHLRTRNEKNNLYGGALISINYTLHIKLHIWYVNQAQQLTQLAEKNYSWISIKYLKAQFIVWKITKIAI